MTTNPPELKVDVTAAMDATRTDYDELLAAAQAARLVLEGDDILHSDDQGPSADALVSIDKWLCWRDDAVRIQIRVIARQSTSTGWDCISEGTFSEPLTREQALQLVSHWSILDREATNRSNQARQRHPY